MRKITNFRLGLLAAAGAAATLLGAAPALAQQGQVVLSKAVAPFDESVRVLGTAAPQAQVKLQIAMQLRDYAGLMASNAEGKVLTPAQMQARHLPTQADYDKVLNWLSASGLNVDKTASTRLTIHVSGDAAVVSRVFGVHFSRVQAEGKEFVASDSAPSLPASIASVVHSVNGLQPYLHAYKLSQIAPMAHTASATTPPFYAQAFVTGYSASGLGDGGRGTTTAIVIDTFPLASDLKQYWSTTGTPQKIKNITFIQAVDGDLPPLSGEESMDAQVASSVAPNAKVRIYASQNLSFASLDDTYDLLIQDMQEGVKVTQLSISLGACERKLPDRILTTDDSKFAVITGLGASIFVSSGDSGSRECGKQTTSFYATSPNVTAAGGTSLTLNGAGETTAETGWSGSGGGLSTFFARPAYQKSLGLGFKMRAIPDISADGNPQTGALVIVNGANNQIGGTSLSAPILAGLTALANADRIANHKKPLGLLNSRIYKIPASNFRDITTGKNGDYSAGPGYDLVTGLGAPIMSELIPTLTAQK